MFRHNAMMMPLEVRLYVQRYEQKEFCAVLHRCLRAAAI